jgi:hypothetical protein
MKKQFKLFKIVNRDQYIEIYPNWEKNILNKYHQTKDKRILNLLKRQNFNIPVTGFPYLFPQIYQVCKEFYNLVDEDIVKLTLFKTIFHGKLKELNEYIFLVCNRRGSAYRSFCKKVPAYRRIPWIEKKLDETRLIK